MVFPLSNFLFRNPLSVSCRPTPCDIKTRFLEPPSTSPLIGTPDLSLPPVILSFPCNPTRAASVS